MNQSNRYHWLLIVEGETDVTVYEELLVRYGVRKSDFYLVAAHGKGFTCNTSTWGSIGVRNAAQSNLFTLVSHDIGRRDFRGILLIIDSDTSSVDAFRKYQRNNNFPYTEAIVPEIKNMGRYWHIDSLNGAADIPIYGINVPLTSSGCLETDLLASYGYPMEGQDGYTCLVHIIQEASKYWNIPLHGDGKDWWEINQRAKLDKFIYAAFLHGFKVSDEKPTLPSEPDVIKNIRQVMGVA